MANYVTFLSQRNEMKCPQNGKSCNITEIKKQQHEFRLNMDPHLYLMGSILAVNTFF